MLKCYILLHIKIILYRSGQNPLALACMDVGTHLMAVCMGNEYLCIISGQVKVHNFYTTMWREVGAQLGPKL